MPERRVSSSVAALGFAAAGHSPGGWLLIPSRGGALGHGLWFPMTTSDYATVSIESTLPKPWEEEHSFSEVLYDWMNRAPWFAISGAAHLLAFFVLTAMPWSSYEKEEVPVFVGLADQPAPDIVDELEPEEVPPVPVESEPVEDLDDAIVTDSVDEISDQDDLAFDPVKGEEASPFDNAVDAMSDVIGIGGPGGSGGDLGGGDGGTKGRGGPKMEGPCMPRSSGSSTTRAPKATGIRTDSRTSAVVSAERSARTPATPNMMWASRRSRS